MEIRAWLTENAGVLFASISSAAVHVAVTWKTPKIAMRHFFIAGLTGAIFGPGFYSVIETLSPFSGDSIRSAAIGIMSLSGVYFVIGVNKFWEKWSENPTFPPWRKP